MASSITSLRLAAAWCVYVLFSLFGTMHKNWSTIYLFAADAATENSLASLFVKTEE